MLGVFAAARDVTLRKQAESAMETLLSLQGAVVESTADGIVVVDRADQWTSFNRKFLQPWRIPPHQVGIGDKQINDTFGHAIGDQVLQQVAGAANGCLRDSDIIGRYGGDEFVIVAPMSTAQQALGIAKRIHAVLAAVRLPELTGAVLSRLALA